MKDRIALVLLLVALVEAGALAWRGSRAPVAAIPIAVAPGQEPPDALPASLAVVGDWVTIEDLARGALQLAEGPAMGASPLTEDERERLKPLVAAAIADRAEMLRVEADLAVTQEALNARAKALAATLTPEQRAWIVAHRSQISVGEVTAAYWAELTRVLENP